MVLFFSSLYCLVGFPYLKGTVLVDVDTQTLLVVSTVQGVCENWCVNAAVLMWLC